MINELRGARKGMREGGHVLLAQAEKGGQEDGQAGAAPAPLPAPHLDPEAGYG